MRSAGSEADEPPPAFDRPAAAPVAATRPAPVRFRDDTDRPRRPAAFVVGPDNVLALAVMHLTPGLRHVIVGPHAEELAASRCDARVSSTVSDRADRR